ncbi:MAG: TrbC family F-type conjugative pilus assembly protein [Pseudomonadota bacterium]
MTRGAVFLLSTATQLALVSVGLGQDLDIDAIATGIARDRDAAVEGIDQGSLEGFRERAEAIATEIPAEVSDLATEAREHLRLRLNDEAAAYGLLGLDDQGEDYPASVLQSRPGPRYVVFASRALGDVVLAGLTEKLADRDDTVIVLRGLAPGETIGDLARAWLESAGGLPAVIDPRPFRDHGVEAVPAVLDSWTGRLVHGTADPDYAATRADGDRVGPTVAILERDIAELAVARLASIDWQARAREAVARFWDRAPLQPMTPAREDRTRVLDTRIRLGRDFALPDGTVLARAGDVIDPMGVQPLTLTLIVFDARSETEIALVERELAYAARPVLMISDLDRDKGWAVLARLEQRFGRPVYLLTPELRHRFRLRHTVSVVTGRDGGVEVRELAARLTTGDAR